MKRKTGFTILACIGLLFCTCSDLTNPFLNKGETKVQITGWSLSDSVSLNIFSTYTIPVRALLGENLDSFKVLIEKNRLFSSQDTVISGNQIRPQSNFSIPFSFYDTGWQKIQLISYKNNGDSTIDTTVYLHAVSPLKQSIVSGTVGDSIKLSTLPVKDQVLYVWNLHNGVVVKENNSSVKMKVTTAFTSRYGELYVEDFSGHRSPVVLFEISAQSQAELSLTCINDSVKGDTVYSTDAQINFRLEVSGAQQLKNAWINGNNFDQNQRRGDDFLLGYNIGGLDTITVPRKLDVVIIDDLGRSVNRSFFVQFIKMEPAILVVFPDDSMQTAASSVDVLGMVSNLRQNSTFYIFASNNGNMPTRAAVTFKEPSFTFEISLPGTSNHITLELFADSMRNGSMLAATDFHVIYNPDHKDTLAPQIRNIRCNGTLVDSFFTSRTDTMHLEIDAVDNSNEITVTVNGNPVSKGAGELFYSAEIVLTHKKESTIIALEALDGTGRSARDTIYVVYNRLPKWVKIPSHTVINADEDHQFQLTATDPDNDPILATMRVGFKSGSVTLNASSGQVTLHPQLADIGTYDVVLEVTDEYEPAVDTFFTLQVKGKDAAPVQFLTSKDNFPDTLIIGDTLSVTLQEIPLTGTRPFGYGAYFIDSKPSTILNGSDNKLRWIPKSADAGLRKLRIEIKDSLGYTDSDTIEIMVLLATVRWEKNYIQFYEDGSVISIPGLRLSRPVPHPVSIEYQVSFPYTPGATESDIMSKLSGTILFKTGDTVSSLMVVVANDNIPENTEKFKILLLENDSIKSDASVLDCEIIDNDLVNFEFVGTEVTHTEKNRTDTAIVKISKPLEKRLELTCLVDTGSTARLVEDFTFGRPDGKVVFEPGDTEAIFLINIINDELQEPNEKVVLKIRSDSVFAAPRTNRFGLPVNNTFTYTIVNDDVPVHYSFPDAQALGSESDTLVSIKVNLDKAIESETVIKYYLDSDPSKNSATLNTDFSFLDNSGVLVFAAGEKTKEIKIVLKDDTIPEDNEFFTLNLHSESNLVLAGSDTTLRYTITTNEVSVSIVGNTSSVNEWTWSDLPIDFQLDGPADAELRVYFSIDDGATADSGKDYVVNGYNYLVFKPGETSKRLTYRIIDDYQSEDTETMTFRIIAISDNRIAYIGNNSWITITIGDNDLR